jgi:benzoyl-CoA reductase/2-hydroxyglutaryl-CoA dehydratase subunit BcrC/BadD/HgdB
MLDSIDRSERIKKRFKLHLSMTVREIFDGIEEDHTRPPEMAYFDDFFKQFADKEKTIVKNKDRKIVGIYCMSVPEELIYAAGAFPVRLCAGSADAAEAGETFFPEVACPMVKAATGFSSVSVLPFYQACDLVIIPATCDWKVKMGEILPVMMLDLPRIKTLENSRLFWLREIERLKVELERLTGNRITANRLKKAISIYHSAQKEFCRFRDIRKSNTHALSGRDAIEVVNAFFYDHVADWTKAMGKLNDALETRLKANIAVTPESAPRVLLTGSPIVFPNWKVPSLIEESGGALVCDELCTSNRYLNDMVAIDERLLDDMLHGIADRYLQPCTCPVFSNTSDRRNKLLQMIDDYKIEGVIHHVLKGCHPYDVELRSIEADLNRKGISQLKIETDYSPEDTEQLRTRVEAFMETLKGRRI